MSRIIVLVLCLAALAIPFVSNSVVEDNGALYKSLEQMNLYYGDSGVGINSNTDFAPQNAHQALVASLSHGDFFNVKILFVVYGIILLAALWLITGAVQSRKYKALNYVFPVILVLIFADYSYTGYFKTLYAKPFMSCLILLWTGLMLTAYRKGVKWYITLPAAAVACCFALTGTVSAIIAVIMGILIMRMPAFGKKNYPALICGTLVIVLSVAFAINYKDPGHEANLYNSIFFGTAQYESVEKLGLDPALDQLKGQFYTKEIARKYDLQNTFFKNMSYAKVLKFYATNWGAAWKALDLAAKNVFVKPYEKGGFSLYGTVKAGFLPGSFVFTVIFLLAYIASLVFLYKRQKSRRPVFELLFGIILMAGVSIKLQTFLYGIADITKNMFEFNLFFDILIAAAIIGGTVILLERRDEKKKKFGITQ